MLICPVCSMQNPQGTLFCGRCGAQIAIGTPSASALPPQQPATQTAIECLPAYRPFGLVFCCVWSGLHTLIWLYLGTFLLYFAVRVAALPIVFAPNLQTARVGAITTFFVAGVGGVILAAVAVLMACATIGLWLRQRWARNLSTYLQIAVGLLYFVWFVLTFAVLLIGLRVLEASVFGSVIGAIFGSLSALAGIVVSYKVASYLMDPNTDTWFR